MTKNRSGPPLKVPAQEEDPVERKRVLNILAQRRYRQRKKEQLRKLEQQLGNGIRDNITCSVESVSPNQVSASMHTSVQTAADEIDLTSANELNGHEIDNPTVEISTPSSAKAREAWNPSVFFPLSDLPPSSQTSETASPTSPRQVGSSVEDPTRTTSANGSISSLGADERNLTVSALGILRAVDTAAKRLGMDETAWELDAISPFYHAGLKSNATTDFSHIPAHLRPTKIQQSYAHHPILDILPWPTTRNRLILVFAQPPESRPPAVASPTALLDFVYQMEDDAEGVRVWGEDPCAAEGWEVGQKLFTKWWWAFDRDVLTNTNQLRRLRGAPSLRIGQIGHSRVVEELP